MAGVSGPEAAQSLAVAQSTVRRRIRRGELQAHQDITPQGFQWAVELEEETQALWNLVDTLKAQVKSQA